MSAPFTLDFWRCLADYQVQFPDLASLGTGAAVWRAEYDRIRSAAFDPVLLTSSSSEGQSGSGQRNQSQAVRADALHCRRYELDTEYPLPAHLAAYPAEKTARARPTRRGGCTIRFGNA